MTTLVDELILNEKRYISAKRAAEMYLYAQDYIGQLCREGKIDAVRVGRNWYVEEASVVEHKQYSNISTTPNGTFLHSTKNSLKPTTKHVKNSFAVYSNDEFPLFPILEGSTETEGSTPVPIRVVVDKELTTKDVMSIYDIPKKYSVDTHQSIFDRILAFTVITAVFSIVTVTTVSLANSDMFVDHVALAKSVVAHTAGVLVETDSAIVPKILDSYRLVAKEIYEGINAGVYTVYINSI